MGKDMTQGSIVKVLLLFTIPLVLSGLFQQLFNWVDAFIVGNVEGEIPLASIGATTVVYNLCITAIIGFTSGLSVLSAQQHGKREFWKMRETLLSFAFILGAFFLVIACVGMVFTTSIVELLNTPDKLTVIAVQYLKIMFISVPFLAIYNVYSGVLRGAGDSRAPFVAVIISSCANVVLDILFVAILHEGAAGAAVATVISQIAMTLFMIGYTEKTYPYLKYRLDKKIVVKTTLNQGSQFGVPPTIQASISSIGNIVLQRFMNGFGEQTIAAITTAYRVDSVIFLPIINFGSGVATVVAQNIGAENEKRANKTLKIGLVMIALISLGLSVFIFFFGEYMMALFGLSSESVAIGKTFFRALAPFYIVYGFSMVLRGYLEGRGDMVFSSAAGVTSLFSRILACYLFVEVFANSIIALSEAFSWFVLLTIYVVRYWRKTAKRNQEMKVPSRQ
ncbi:MATE family efflux transporter [Enterococcus florum]|uniref:Probable multidrug resistance protein NorM n=1 Tax=Enterococcus florum TaxID=2480627 RepID=A0A4P5P976_9ENTE|nr:MATE family efflux transporter [Enterococcus florum]GCF92854.1 MATE family efflux transporter [Enterococcus florum]